LRRKTATVSFYHLPMQISDGEHNQCISFFRYGSTRLAVRLALACVLYAAHQVFGAESAVKLPSDASSPSTDPVLNLLLEKGMITEEEAAKTQAQADALRTNMAAQYMAENSKWTVGKTIKNAELYGDVRVRYEDREAAAPAFGGTKAKVDLYRFRYAVRLGLRGDAYDDFYYGIRLETSSNPRSTWVTMGSSSPDPFGKSQGTVQFGQLYMGWHPGSWFEFTAGKMPNPLFTSSMVWSPSINPEGLAEHSTLTVGDLDIFANFAQFLYQDQNPIYATPNVGLGTFGQSQDNVFQLAWQGGLNYHIATNISVKVGATIYQYFGLKQSSTTDPTGLSPFLGDIYIGESPFAGANAANGAYYGSSGYSPGTIFSFGSGAGQSATYSSLNYPLNQVGLNKLLVLEVPFELNLKYWGLNFKVFGDFAYNLDGRARAEAAAAGFQNYLTFVQGSDTSLAFKPQTSDVKAYQFGLAVGTKDSLGMVNGTTVKKHAWEVRTYWQHIEQYSLDPNLLDLDFNAGAENLEGIYTALAYGFSDNLMATVRYGHARRINNLLGTGGTGTDIPYINPVKSYDLLQADLTFKF